MTLTAASSTGERTARKNSPGAAPRTRRSGRLRRIGLPYLLLLPALLLELLVHLVPSGYICHAATVTKAAVPSP
ncbi:hypothetical protein ABZ129_15080, partial [Streptomyces sp. NPDC006307]